MAGASNHVDVGSVNRIPRGYSVWERPALAPPFWSTNRGRKVYPAYRLGLYRQLPLLTTSIPSIHAPPDVLFMYLLFKELSLFYTF